jgi:hypothetical protein
LCGETRTIGDVLIDQPRRLGNHARGEGKEIPRVGGRHFS